MTRRPDVRMVMGEDEANIHARGSARQPTASPAVENQRSDVAADRHRDHRDGEQRTDDAVAEVGALLKLCHAGGLLR